MTMKDNLISIGEVSKIIGRSAQTIKSWYEWAIETGDTSLPDIHFVGVKNTRFFNKEDIPKLEAFRDSIKYGQMASISRSKWGKRGIKDGDKSVGSSEE